MQMTVSLRTLALGTVALLMIAPGRAQTEVTVRKSLRDGLHTVFWLRSPFSI